ncbi:MAG: UDP-N-acetylmuramoyl-L-alanyl-D-glutamate--2,6-diaminopimelate ligase [Clostridia bacterium]|nr:UDP-N-acetylmuramoyl-L-alanyl-D-glutamate--2,6-diaminopimelate ligase [Clostridia bacterium]
MLLSDILKDIDHTCADFRDGEIEDIVYDSRKAKPGTLFVALRGAFSDGHDFAESAYFNGARYFLAEHALSLPENAVTVIAADTRAALSVISAAFFGHPEKQLQVIGVTGTKGKTTVTHMLRHCLDAVGIPSGVIGTVGAYYGDKYVPTVNTTPESYETLKLMRQMADAGIKAVCMEVSSLGLKHHRVDSIRFQEAVFTNLSPDHIGGAEHESFAEYVYWKTQLFAQCDRAVLCADQPYSEEIKKKLTVPCTDFAVHAPAYVRAENISQLRGSNFFGVGFTCFAGAEQTQVRVSMPGLFSVENALACIAVCMDMGVKPEQVAAALATVRVKGRNDCIPVEADYDVVIDYAHNGQSFRSVIETFAAYDHARIITVFGSVGDRAQLRRREMGLVSGSLADLSILTTDDPGFEEPESICADIAAAVKEAGGRYEIIPDRAEAVSHALTIAQKDDIVLLLGKGHETAQKICGKKVPYSDYETVDAFFRDRERRT